MKKIIYTLIIVGLFFCYGPSRLYAADPVTVTADSEELGIGASLPDSWVPSRSVTVAGKLAARSGDFFDWTIAKYNWACIDKNCNGNNASGNPFANIYKVVRDIIYAVLSLSILFSAFIMIITRGQEIKATKFIGRFILTVLLVTIIYSLVVFIYQVVDIVVGFFLQYHQGNVSRPISHQDLLNVFDYHEFKQGYKRAGLEYAESAFVSLWLTRITAVTYFAISVILIVRKIILWFFLIISPLFPLLLLFKGLRGVYKVWLGEFFRWLFYAPLFAVLLSGVVSIWILYIPIDLKLNCQNTPRTYPDDPKYKYPTSINILLGGPCQSLSEDNNLNTPDSFIQYVAALLMLWMVIIVPFLLLKMLIEYFSKSFEENNLWRLAVQKGGPLLERYRPSFLPTKPPDLPFKPVSPETFSGLEKPLPVLQGRGNLIKNYSENLPGVLSQSPATVSMPIPAHIGEQIAAKANLSQSVKSSVGSQVSTSLGQQTSFDSRRSFANVKEIYADILNLTNLSVPTMVDVSRYETAQLSGEIHLVDDLNKIAEGLKRIGGLSQLTTPQEKITYLQIKQQLEAQAVQKNPVAASILSASQPNRASALPDVNQVQTVALADYEMVKKLWKQNYQKVEPPKVDQKQLSKKEWLKLEKDAIEKAMRLIASSDPKEVAEGKQMLSKILPFLLLGGFSKAEIVAYLKAKQEAATEVLEELEKTAGLVEVQTKKKEEEKHLIAETEINDKK